METDNRTIDELCEPGVVKAYGRAKALHPKKVSRNLLWALAAGLQERDWRELSKAEKDKLLAEVRSLRR